MSFDWQAFAGSFLNTITADIDEREEQAEKYKEQQEEAAARNASLVADRRMRAQEAASYGKKAMNLGATESQVKAAISSGMTGIKELADKLQEAANSKGIKKLGVDDIEAIVSMPNIPTVNQSLVDMSLQEFAEKTYGANITQKAEIDTDDNLIKQLFGFGDKDRVKKELRETEYSQGLSIADINEMANQAEYRSLMPDATMTFLDIENYTPKLAMEFNADLTEAMSDAVDGDVADAYVKSRVAALGPSASLEERNEERMKARRTLQVKAASKIIEGYADTYAGGGFFDNQLSLKQIKDIMGDAYYNNLLTQYGMIEEEDETEDNIRETKSPSSIDSDDPRGDLTEKEAENKEKEKADTKAKEEKVSATKKKFGKVYYRNDEGEIVDGVPPRPTREFSNLFFGAGMGGDDIESIMKGEMPVPKYLRPSQWDELFGDDYNPDGTIKD